MKKILCYLLCIILLVQISVAPVKAETGNYKAFKGENYKIEISSQSEWDGGYTVNVSITNTGKSKINEWAIRGHAKGFINNVWNAVECKNSKYIMFKSSDNGIIMPDQTVTFGYSIQGGQFSDISDVELIEAKKIEHVAQDYKVYYNITNTWQSNATVEATIENCSDEEIKSWELKLDFDNDITNWWNADIEENNSFIITPKEYNSIINPQEKVTFGFQFSFEKEISMPFNEKLFSYKFVDDQSFEQDSTESQTTEKNTTAQEQTTEPPATTESENIYEEDYSNIDWDNKKDSDDDGLPDVMELYQYGTNVLEKDSDGDGLQDGYEVLHTFTNPSKKDTDENGINDGYEDLDEDGLSNLEEYNIGSEPLLKDMDEDGLSDGDEATYGTKYDIADTDGDGINDFDEIQLSLNPNKKETHPGIPDSEYEISQSLSEKELSDVNDCIDEFNVSIDVTATNNLKTHMQVELEEGNNVINSNNALVGEPISVNYYEGKISSGEIRFSLSAEELKDENKYFEEDYGIKRYSIFSYDEQENMIIPVKCKYDVSNNEISIDASCNMGILFLMDIEEMLHSMGSNDLAGNTHNEMPKALKVKQMFSNIKSIDEGVEIEPANCSKPVDLVFAVDASLSNRGTITQLQRELNDFVAKLNSNNINLRMSFIRYLDVKFNGKGSTWVNYYSEDFLTNVSDMTNMINKIEPEGASRYSSIIEPLCYSNELEYRDNATKIVVVFTSSPMNQENSFGYGEIGDILKKLKKNDINVCIAGTNNLEAVYSYIPGYNGGKGIYMTNSYMKQLYNYIDKMAGTEYDYNAVALNNLAPVFLDEKLIKGAACDTDGDGLTDSQETDWSKLADLMDSTGKTSIVLPSLKKVWDSMGVSYNTDGIMQCLLEQKVLPVISFPNLMDSDGDDLIDSKDSDVLQYNPYEIDDSLLDDSLTPPDASENQVAKANVFMSMKKAPTISNPTVRNVDVKDGICTYKFASSKNKKRTLIGELKPVKNSDYTVRVVSKSGFKNKDTSIKVYYKKGKKKKVYVDSYKSSTKSISVKEKHYILKQNKTYYIEFICKTEKNEDVRVECNQDNWVSCPDGGIWEVESEHLSAKDFLSDFPMTKYYITREKLYEAACESQGSYTNNENLIRAVMEKLGYKDYKITFDDVKGAVVYIATLSIQFIVVKDVKVEGLLVMGHKIKNKKIVSTFFFAGETIDTLEKVSPPIKLLHKVINKLEYDNIKDILDKDYQSLACSRMIKNYGLKCWDAWKNTGYINKYVSGKRGSIDSDIDVEKIIKFCGWKNPNK